MAKTEFYTYIHRKRTNGEVFYVGKGSDNRAWSEHRRKRHWQSIVKKHGYTVEIVRSGLQEWAAFELEIELIALYGRKDCGYGTLTNVTDGGDGPSGTVFTEAMRLAVSNRQMGDKNISKRIDVRAKLSASILSGPNPMHNPEARAKSSASHTGRKASAETRAKMSASHTGKIFSDATRAKISAHRTGRKHTEEACLKMTESQKERWAVKKSLQHSAQI